MKLIKAILISLSCILILLTVLLVAPKVMADDVIEIQEASLSAKNFNDYTVDSFVPHPKNEYVLTLNSNVYSRFYWNNSIHSQTDVTQFRMVGLESRLGIYLSSHIDIGFYHFSKHMLDSTIDGHYPNMDAIELKIYFFKRYDKRDGLF